MKISSISLSRVECWCTGSVGSQSSSGMITQDAQLIFKEISFIVERIGSWNKGSICFFVWLTNPSNTIHWNQLLRTITIHTGDPVTYKTWNEKITPAERKFEILTD